jgi:hypothetical protein
MAEQLLKLSPHRDLQAYYFQPSAIAALSGATETGFTFSGSWRQQWDWAVVEWNRDNTFEHPLLRYLPDNGTPDFTGLTLSYIEQRTNCVPLESNIYPSVEWPYLRSWVPNGTSHDDIYFVRLADYATPAPGSSYQNASVTMTLTGNVTPNLRVGLAFIGTFAAAAGPSGVPIEQQYWYAPQTGDTTLVAVAVGLANAINAGSQDIEATAQGNSIVCTYRGTGSLRDKTGANANRIGVYGFVQEGSQVSWAQPLATFNGGQFPDAYAVTLPFDNLQGVKNDPSLFFSSTSRVLVPANNIRKMRWTWAADLQPASFIRTEFQVVVSQWTVTGGARLYSVAGPGSRRIEEDDAAVVYTGTWSVDGPANYSGSYAMQTSQAGATCSMTYTENGSHYVYLGTHRLAGAAVISVSIDGQTPISIDLNLTGEDVMVRIPLGELGLGTHTVEFTNLSGGHFYFDFLEIAYPSVNLPDVPVQPQLTLATDWDTLHSQALPPERTAWILWKLGFHGRVNHYVGALWWYELVRPGHQYASVTATISVNGSSPTGYAEFDFVDATSTTTIQHLNLPDDTAASIALALAMRINQGTTALWASASGNIVTITSRFLGSEGNGMFTVSSFSGAGNVAVTLSSNALSGGVDGIDVGLDSSQDSNAPALQTLTSFWRTDLSFGPGVNRACRDWSKAFFQALAKYGIEATAAFSTELAHVDPTPAAGMAQRYWDGTPVLLNTPAVQTNFSPASLSFWQRVYVSMAGLQASAGLVPYLQSGEVQWWYFPKPGVSMPFYDDYTKQQFSLMNNGESMAKIDGNDVEPSTHPREAQLLQSLLGAFTMALRTALKAAYPTARYEVLYPGDVNVPAFNTAVNLPTSDWTPENLTCLKTEGLSFPGERNLDASLQCMRISAQLGFANNQRNHLVGITDAKTAWMKEADLAQAEGVELVVLFALDQFCLMGYRLPPFVQQRWSRKAA